MQHDDVDYAALDRMFTTEWWFRYVGVTPRQREGIEALVRDTGPRGSRGDEIANELSGEAP